LYEDITYGRFDRILGFLTDKRLELLEAIIAHGSLKEAAKVVGISEEAAKGRLFSLRMAYDDNKKDCTGYEKYRLKLERYL
jgi:predicted transcriptional regulator